MAVSALAHVPREMFGAFLGINLRRDGLALADEDVLRAINADLHTQPGVIRLRAGRSLHNSAILGSPSAVRTLAWHNPRRYQVASTSLYRDYVSILTGLHATTLVTTLVPSRPLNDTTTWSFIADQGLTPLMRKDNGTVVRNWGIAAPTATPVIVAGAAGSLTGLYGARYTYARVVGSSVAHESNPCPAPAAVSLSSQTLDIPVVASADPQVTHIRVYRTLAGGSTWFFDQQVANTTATINSSQADSALGTEIETDNTPPVPVGWVTEFQNHLFTCLDAANPHYLWYSKRFRPEAFPSDQFLELGNPTDPLQCALALTGVLGVFARTTKYRVFGNAVSGFAGIEALSTRGTPAPNAATITSKGVCFVARDGLFLTTFMEADVEISQAIQALFYGETVNAMAPIDWAQTAALTLAEYKRRLYFGYQDTAGARMLAVYSLDTQHWYHYVHPVHRLLVEEDTDVLRMGDTGGQVWTLETGTRDGGTAISLAVDLPPRAFGDRLRHKGLEWLAVDSEGGGTWSVQLLVDDAVVTTATVTGARTRRFLPLPADTGGRIWQAKLTYAGTGPAACYGIEIREPDPSTGQVWLEDPTVDDQYLDVRPGALRQQVTQRDRLTFLTLEAEAASAGTWTVRLFLDSLLRETLSIAGDGNRRLYKLASELLAAQWIARLRYSSSPAPAVHRVLAFDSGVPDGQIWVKDPVLQDVYLDLLPAQSALDRFTKQRWEYLKFDAEATTGTWTLDVYIDDVFRYQLPLSGARNRALRRLPAALLGAVWHLRARYSTTPVPPVYAAQLYPGTALKAR